jgi:hypothetical protein
VVRVHPALACCDDDLNIPDDDHVAVHLLQLLLGDLEGIWWRVQLVCLEALIVELDLEWLFVGLSNINPDVSCGTLGYHWAEPHFQAGQIARGTARPNEGDEGIGMAYLGDCALIDL